MRTEGSAAAVLGDPQARTGDWLGIFQPPQRQQVPRDDQVVHAEKPAVAGWFQQIPGLAQGVE